MTDPSGAVIPGASVRLRNGATGITHVTKTSQSGYFRFPSLPASNYRLTVVAAGFKTSEIPEFNVQATQTKTVNVSLELGTAETVVNVQETPPPVETAEGRVSGLIQTQDLTELPVVGRNFYALVVLTPGVTGLPSGGGQAYAQATSDVFNVEYGVNLNANGLRAEENGFNVDSGSTTSMVRHGVTNLIPNAESVEELRVSVNNFSAENGGNAGALVSVITKQGTNDWHGTANWYHTNNVLQSRNEFQSKVPVFRRNEGTWSLGGPIFKNKTFVFASMDVLRSGVAQGFATNVPTQDFVNYMQQNYPNRVSTYLLKTFPTDIVRSTKWVSRRRTRCTPTSLDRSPISPQPRGWQLRH